MKRVLLVEPYPELADMIAEMLTEAGYQVDCAMTAYEMRTAITNGSYDCIMLNLDQNRTADFGLQLADEASRSGSPIVMIPDFAADTAKIAEKGWLQLKKPFTIAGLQAVLERAVGSRGDISARHRPPAQNAPEP